MASFDHKPFHFGYRSWNASIQRTRYYAVSNTQLADALDLCYGLNIVKMQAMPGIDSQAKTERIVAT